MPRIFDNIEASLLPALKDTLELSDHADFCVGDFNLRGWKQIHQFIDKWSGGESHCCRLLVGMQRLPQEELRDALRIVKGQEGIDNQTAIRLRKKLAEEFREQLMIGMPTADDEAGLRRLAAQIREKKVVVKLFLRHPLHAKLYLLFRPNPIAPKIGYLGSSNLTLAGLSHQGELNVDVLDQDACSKMSRWFEDRWEDRFCMDISSELAAIINESWAREKPLPPYHIYLKMAYHLSQEARLGLTEFRIPHDFGNQLFEFQVQAVKIASHHLNKRGGVLIGDVVGLGKTLMATAVARIFEDDQNDQAIRDLFTERAGILDGDADTEVDLSSYAYQIWKNAVDNDPSLQKVIPALPNVVYSTKPHTPSKEEPEGALVYVRTAQGNDALAWVNRDGKSITESQFAILKAAECTPDTPSVPRLEDHHKLVQAGVESVAREERTMGGQLGRPSGARFRTYERLQRYAEQVKDTLFDNPQLRRAIEDIYAYPLRQVAIDILNRQLRSGISDEALAQRVLELREDGRLCIMHEEEELQEPRIICSLGLKEEA